MIDAKELADTPVPNIMNLLQGRVAGMDIQMNNGLRVHRERIIFVVFQIFLLLGIKTMDGIWPLLLRSLWWMAFRRQM